MAEKQSHYKSMVARKAFGIKMQAAQKKAAERKGWLRPDGTIERRGNPQNLVKLKKGDPAPPGAGIKKPAIPELLRRIGSEHVTVRTSATDMVSMSKMDAVMTQVFNKALTGDMTAVNFIADRTEGKALDRIQLLGKVVHIEICDENGQLAIPITDGTEPPDERYTPDITKFNNMELVSPLAVIPPSDVDNIHQDHE